MIDRKVRIYLKTDSVNSVAKSYRLTINGVPTPLEAYGGYSYPIILNPTTGTTTLSKRTCVGT